MTTVQTLAFALADLLRGSTPDDTLAQKREKERKRRQEKARDQVRAWAQKTVAPLTWVQQDDFVERLIELIHRPYLLDQSGFASCGAVSICGALLHDYPDEMAKCATDVFEKGFGKIGKLPLTLTGPVRQARLEEIEKQSKAVKHEAPAGADWLLFSVVQSDFQHTYSGVPRNVTGSPPRARALLGETELYGAITIPGTTSRLDANLRNKRANDDQVIILFINSSKIDNKGEDVIATPEHLAYLEAVQPFVENGDEWAVFSFFSWGQRRVMSMKVSDLMGGVRGYLHGRRLY